MYNKRKAQLCGYHKSQLLSYLLFYRLTDIYRYSSVLSLDGLKWQYFSSLELPIPMQSHWLPIRWDQELKLLPSSKDCVRKHPYQSPTQLTQTQMLRELNIKKRQKPSAVYKLPNALWALPSTTATKYKTFGYVACNAIKRNKTPATTKRYTQKKVGWACDCRDSIPLTSCDSWYDKKCSCSFVLITASITITIFTPIDTP